jgi:hypothetical protein
MNLTADQEQHVKFILGKMEYPEKELCFRFHLENGFINVTPYASNFVECKMSLIKDCPYELNMYGYTICESPLMIYSATVLKKSY